MNCWFCGSKLIWGGDHNYEDVYGEGQGIVTNLHCSKCNAEVEYRLRDGMEE